MFKKILLTLSLFFALLPFAWAQDDASILIVGDSLSAGFGIPLQEGWVALLQTRLAEQGYGYRVVNASISGDTTQGALSRLPRALKVHAPRIVILELGGNDGLRGFPLQTMRRNFERMIEMSLEAGARVLLLGIRLPENYGAEYTEKFHLTYRELADKYDLALAPWFLEGVAMETDLMQADGIHPNSAAQPRLLENVWTVLATELER